jgi:excisionase family DNA binding protein
MMTTDVSNRPDPAPKKNPPRNRAVDESVADTPLLAAPEPDETDQLAGAFKLAEVARLCRVSLPAVTRWVLSLKLRSFKVGHQRLVPREALNEFLRGGTNRRATESAARTPSERQKAADQAVETCRSLGV